MSKDLVTLRRMDRPDYELLVDWMDDVAGIHANGAPQYTSADAFMESNRAQGYTYLMVVDGEGEPVGAVSWKTLSYPGNYLVGLIIGDKSKWARGYGAVATSLLFSHLFHHKNAHRVEIRTGVFNKETMKIAVRDMMVIEGILRDQAFLDGEYHDVIVCSLLRHEYYERVERGMFTPYVDLIAPERKSEARRLLLDHLNEHGKTMLASLIDRDRRGD